MLTATRRTLRSHPSLLLLRRALIVAERDAPSDPPRFDANERLAAQLIARMQANYKKEPPFIARRDAPRPVGARLTLHDMAGAHAR